VVAFVFWCNVKKSTEIFYIISNKAYSGRVEENLRGSRQTNIFSDSRASWVPSGGSGS
jgi:hypothetical protein